MSFIFIYAFQLWRLPAIPMSTMYRKKAWTHTSVHTNTHNPTQLMIHNCHWSWIILGLTEGQKSGDEHQGSRQQLFGWAEYLLSWDSWKAGRRGDQRQSRAGNVIRIHRELRLRLFIHLFCPSVCRGGCRGQQHQGDSGEITGTWMIKMRRIIKVAMEDGCEEQTEESWRTIKSDLRWSRTAEKVICPCAAEQSGFRSSLRQWAWWGNTCKQVFQTRSTNQLHLEELMPTIRFVLIFQKCPGQ